MKQPIIHRELALLHPRMRDRAWDLLKDLNAAQAVGELSIAILPFETYRSPIRQDWLRENQPKNTNASAWESAHQYGMAVDFCGWIDHKPTWQVPTQAWELLHKLARARGLVAPISWDLGHIELEDWQSLKPAA